MRITKPASKSAWILFLKVLIALSWLSASAYAQSKPQYIIHAGMPQHKIDEINKKAKETGAKVMSVQAPKKAKPKGLGLASKVIRTATPQSGEVSGASASQPKGLGVTTQNF